MAKTICSNNLIHGKPLPENMLTFAGAVLSEQVSPPASKKGQSDARRNRVLARLVFEVFVLFDLSQQKAQEAVHEGAQRAGLVVPARLREIWEASEEWKSRRIPRTRARKAKVRREASDRLEFFVGLSARHAE